MNIISKFLLIIFLFLLFETKSYSQASGDSTEITIDSITTKVEIFQNKISNSEISFIIDQIKVNNESIKIEPKNKQSYNVKLNERDTLEMELSISSNNEIIFNYFFNDNQNYRVLNNGKIVYDKASKKIYFDFIPNNTQAQNKFITWNLFANNLSGGIAKYNLTIEITNLDYPPKILNKQIDKIIREKYIFDYIPIISDGDDGVLFSLETDAPINEFNPINGKISWTIDPNEIKVLEKTFSFFMKVYKVNNPEKFDSDTFKIIYSEKNYAPVFGKTSKWIVEEGKYHEYKIPVEDPNVNDSFVIENVGAQFPRDMILDSKNKMIKFSPDYEHVTKSNGSQNYNLQLKATDISGLSSQNSLEVVVLNSLNPEKVQEKINILLKELTNQQNKLDGINENLKWIEAKSKNNRKIRTFSAAAITFLGGVVGVLASNSEVSRKGFRLAGPIIGASGAVLSVFNEVLSGEDNEIKNLLQETIKLQSNVIAKYDRLKYFKDSKNNTDFENQEVDLLIRTIENDRETLNKNLFTISENYKRIISEKRIKNILLKK
tara:strand:+ start:7710 stop:9350 length:1641 start_codon:yes stop_codon:yes gene_type:complete